MERDMHLSPLRLQTKFFTRHKLGPPTFVMSHLYLARRVVEGNRMYVNPTNNLNLFLTGLYEPLETQVIRDHVRTGDTVLDVGANIGYFTLLCAKLVGENGRVFAFEPDTVNFGWLERNVRVNGFQNVVLVRKAVSSKTGTAKLYVSSRYKGDNRIYDSEDGRRTFNLEAVALNDFFDGFTGRIDFIKLVIQGAEQAALEGMQKILQSNSNLKLVTMFWPGGLERSGGGPKDYLELLLSNGFRLYDINEERGSVVATSASDLLKTYAQDDETFTTILCLRGDGGR